MTINVAAGAAAYAKAATRLALPGGSETVKGAGSGFADLLKSAISDAVQTQKTGEAATMQAATGKADINNVVAAVNNAELTLQTVMAVRDKVVAAYTEIMHMTV
jgi:flagellar hook-basal body complex protein FliE